MYPIRSSGNKQIKVTVPHSPCSCSTLQNYVRSWEQSRRGAPNDRRKTIKITFEGKKIYPFGQENCTTPLRTNSVHSSSGQPRSISDLHIVYTGRLTHLHALLDEVVVLRYGCAREYRLAIRQFPHYDRGRSTNLYATRR